MSLDRYPPRSEVMGWNPQQLAEYLKRMSLASCEKTVLKNSISGSRFVNLTDNDLQKFPKTMAPMISKISNEISKKEEKRGLFGKKPTPKYHEPTDTPVEAQGWGDDEFDHDDDYESPFSGDEDDSGGDYESPNEEVDGNDYEPPPTEPPDDLPPKLCRPQGPIGDDDYIDNHVQSRSNPPAVSPRPPMSTLSAPSPRPTRESSTGRDPSPHCGGRPSGKLAPEPPQIFRNNKPGRSNPSPIRGPHRNTVERPGAQAWKPQSDGPDPPAWTKPSTLPPNSTSSARPPPSRFDAKKEQTQDAPKHNTFPLHTKGLPPRPGIPGPPSRHGDSLPSNVTPPGASLPQKLQSVLAEHRASFSGADSRPSLRPAAPTAASCSQELDPVWYVGKVTRGQAEGCLRRVNKDGAYLVRDSTRQQANQPFTLMVLYQGKVYNIQIRQQNQQFMLGTGLKAQECFPSVHEIIDHYFQFPLLLIDAKSRSVNQQNQCVLSDPAGYYMTGQSWS